MQREISPAAAIKTNRNADEVVNDGLTAATGRSNHLFTNDRDCRSSTSSA
jgi:hypothetical protein